MLTLAALAKLRDFYPKPFQVAAVTIDPARRDDFAPIADLCRELGVDYHLVPVPSTRSSSSTGGRRTPAPLCAKLRRGALSTELNRLGFHKIALGHHYDDAVETMLMSLFLEGRISCFQPVTYLDRSGVTQIRPLLYVQEREVRGAVRRLGLPVVENPCPANGSTRREEMKVLLRELTDGTPTLKRKFSALSSATPSTAGAWRRSSGEKLSKKADAFSAKGDSLRLRLGPWRDCDARSAQSVFPTPQRKQICRRHVCSVGRSGYAARREPRGCILSSAASGRCTRKGQAASVWQHSCRRLRANSARLF